MGSMASQITSLTIVYSAVYSGTDQRKHQGSASLAFVRRIHRGHLQWQVNLMAALTFLLLFFNSFFRKVYCVL